MGVPRVRTLGPGKAQYFPSPIFDDSSMLTANAHGTPPLPADRRSTLPDVQLLSPVATPRHGGSARSVRVGARTHAAAIRVCCEGLCRNAGARASAGERTAPRVARVGTQGAQAFRDVAQERTAILAGALLRLQCVDRGKGDREAEVYSPQSCETGTRDDARRLAVVELSALRDGRGGRGRDRVAVDVVQAGKPVTGGIQRPEEERLRAALAGAENPDPGHPQLWRVCIPGHPGHPP